MNATQRKNVERFQTLVVKKLEKGELTAKEEERLVSLRDLVEVRDYIKTSVKNLNVFIKLIKGD